MSCSACIRAAAISRHYLASGRFMRSVAERFFPNTKVNHFLLEYDTQRAGDFKPLRVSSKGKGVVARPDQQQDRRCWKSLDDLKRAHRRGDRSLSISTGSRFRRNAALLPPSAGNPVTEADQRKKLELEVRAGAIWRPSRQVQSAIRRRGSGFRPGIPSFLNGSRRGWWDGPGVGRHGDRSRSIARLPPGSISTVPLTRER